VCVCERESVCALSNSVHWHHQQRNALFSATQSSCRQTNTTLFYSELLIHQTNSVFVCVALFNCRVWLFCYFDSIDLCDQQKKYFNPFFHQHFHPLFILFEWTVRRLEWTWGCLRTKKNSLGWKKSWRQKKTIIIISCEREKKSQSDIIVSEHFNPFFEIRFFVQRLSLVSNWSSSIPIENHPSSSEELICKKI